MNLSTYRSAFAIIPAALLLLSNCGGNDVNPPVGPGPTPTIAPTAAPTAAPVPPSELRLSKSCMKLKAGSPTAKCGRSTPAFQAQVDAAILKVQHQKPGIFDGNSVLSSGQYVMGVIQNLDEVGICAFWDGEELGVKTEDWYNDQYDILTSRGTVWFGPNNYMSTCEPAAFPLDLPGLPGQVAGCSLPPSRELICSKDRENDYLAAVDTAIGNAIAQHPEYFDMKDFAAMTNNPKILNWEGYLGAVTKELKAKGLCVIHDEEELVVKRTNERSEHFDIVTSSMHVLRGYYASSCYPAAF